MSDNQEKPDGKTQVSDNNQETNPRSSLLFYLALIGSSALLSTVVALSFAEFYRNLIFSKFLAVILISEVVAVIVVVSVLRSKWAVPFQQKKPTFNEADESTSETEEDKWLLRLVLVTALGMCIVVIYAVQWLDADAIAIAGVGLLAAGATWLIAAVIGFLFSIPHREHMSSLKVPQKAEDKSKEMRVQDIAPTPHSRLYEGSTSLEQVSDWLTKIIVGVSLTQLNKIPTKLDGLATYIASGMGGNTSNNRVFALTICIYFSSCGFLFGYLWARLYMLKAFERAETMEQKRLASARSQMVT